MVLWISLPRAPDSFTVRVLKSWTAALGVVLLQRTVRCRLAKLLKGTEHQLRCLGSGRDISPKLHKIFQAKLFSVGPCMRCWSMCALDMTMTCHDHPRPLVRHPKLLPVAGSFLSRRLPSLFARHLSGCKESVKGSLMRACDNFAELLKWSQMSKMSMCPNEQ